MNLEQELLSALPLASSTGFADSLYTSQLMLNYVATTTLLEEQTATAIADGDTMTAFRLADMRTQLDDEVFSLSFDA